MIIIAKRKLVAQLDDNHMTIDPTNTVVELDAGRTVLSASAISQKVITLIFV